MRSYPRNSPQAAARILAVTMMADGHVSKVELETLDKLKAHETLGLSLNELRVVLHHFCDDLQATSANSWGDACKVDQRTLLSMLDEIDEPVLRQHLLKLCVSLVEADHHVAEGESQVLVAAIDRWGQHHMMFDTQPH